MSRFVNSELVDEIKLANGDRCWVRQALTGLEQAELTRVVARMKIDTEDGVPTMEEGDWHLSRVKLCQIFLVRWDLKDDLNEAVPCTPENVARLDNDSIQEIATNIDRLQKARKDQSQKKG